MKEERQKSNNNLLGVGVLILLIGAGIYYFMGREQFNIEFKVCDISYQDCNVIAKFKDRYDCETTNEKWGWRCDSITNPAVITCTNPTDSFATGYCD